MASVVSLATPHTLAMEWALRRPDQFRRSWYMAAFQVPRLPERWASRVLERSLLASGLNPSDAARYATRFADPTSLTGPIHWYRAIGLSQPPTDPVVRVPTTYVWGHRDRYLGRAAAEKTRDFVAADYTFLELDASHWLPEDQPDATASAIIDRVARA